MLILFDHLDLAVNLFYSEMLLLYLIKRYTILLVWYQYKEGLLMGMARDFTDFLSFRLTDLYVLKSFVMPYKLTVLKKEEIDMEFDSGTEQTGPIAYCALTILSRPKRGVQLPKAFIGFTSHISNRWNGNHSFRFEYHLLR